MSIYYQVGHFGGHIGYLGKYDLDLFNIELDEFLGPKNICFDTKIISLCGIVFEIISIIYPVGHFGGHIGYLGKLQGGVMPSGEGII